LPNVPDALVTLPRKPKSSGFDLTAQIAWPGGPQVGFACNVMLMKRTLKKGKWSTWTKHAQKQVDSNYRAIFKKIKLSKNKYQFKVVGIDVSLGSLTTSVTVS
jgi:hypothetical protein